MQTWESQSSTSDEDSADSRVRTRPHVLEEGDPLEPRHERVPDEAVSQHAIQESRTEADKTNSFGENNEITQSQNLEEDEESVLIRRVGFVFLDYNAEYWCVAHVSKLKHLNWL